jgi:streptomycin 3"-adenylyltransferase
MTVAHNGLPAAAGEAAAAHLARIDDAAPGLVTGLHVTGSPALGDYWPGTSDLDLVGELSREPTAADLTALATAHVGLGIEVDAVYLRPGDLTKPVQEVTGGPWGRDGVLNTSKPAYLTPVLWAQLNDCSATLRGTRPKPPVTALEVERYCRENLVEYWQPLLEQASALLAGKKFLISGGVQWIAFGPARLWHTIRTGEIVSKIRAAELAAEQWPDLAQPLRVLIAARRGEQVTLTAEHGEAALELGKRVLAAVQDRSSSSGPFRGN